MPSFAHQLRDARIQLGMTQAQLGGRAGVSLATVQSIEAGRANPALRTLARITDVLGLRVTLSPVPPDEAALIDHGLPLSGGSPEPLQPTPDGLRRHLGRAIQPAARGPDDDAGRAREALQALLLALAQGYPSRYRAWFGGSPLAAALLPTEPSGRIIKLKRVADRALAAYL